MLDKTRDRRTKDEIQQLKDHIYRIAEEEHPTNLRHIFYRLISEKAIEKSEDNYDNVVIRLASIMRRNGPTL